MHGLALQLNQGVRHHRPSNRGVMTSRTTRALISGFMAEDLPDVLHVGYSTEDEYRWMCDSCFAEFKDRFRWVVIGDETSSISESRG
jgi:hypothetical protein